MLDRDHLGVLDIRARRNAFGRQVRSFEADVERRRGRRRAACTRSSSGRRGWTSVGAEVEVLASVDGHPVAVRQGNVHGGRVSPRARPARPRLHRAAARAGRRAPRPRRRAARPAVGLGGCAGSRRGTRARSAPSRTRAGRRARAGAARRRAPSVGGIVLVVARATARRRAAAIDDPGRVDDRGERRVVRERGERRRPRRARAREHEARRSSPRGTALARRAGERAEEDGHRENQRGPAPASTRLTAAQPSAANDRPDPGPEIKPQGAVAARTAGSDDQAVAHRVLADDARLDELQQVVRARRPSARCRTGGCRRTAGGRPSPR